MAGPPGVERENLASFLADLSPAGHAMVVLDGLAMADALRGCAESARERGARFVSLAEEGSLPTLDLGALREPALVAVDAGASIGRASAARHLGAERAVGTGGAAPAVIVCIYRRDALRALGDLALLTVANAHRDLLLPEAPA